MADEAPKFFTPNATDSIGSGSAPDPAKPGPQDKPESGPRPNTTGPGSHPGASPNKPAPDFMRE